MVLLEEKLNRGRGQKMKLIQGRSKSITLQLEFERGKTGTAKRRRGS